MRSRFVRFESHWRIHSYWIARWAGESLYVLVDLSTFPYKYILLVFLHTFPLFYPWLLIAALNAQGGSRPCTLERMHALYNRRVIQATVGAYASARNII